jgi:hypothetical protein
MDKTCLLDRKSLPTQFQYASFGREFNRTCLPNSIVTHLHGGHSEHHYVGVQ